MQRRFGRVLLATFFAVGLWVAPISADDLDVDELAAAAAFPIITGTGASGGDVITAVTITNAADDVTVLHAFIISGDPEDQWGAVSLDCPLSGRETTVFKFMPFEIDGDNLTKESLLEVECSTDGDENDSYMITKPLPAGLGTLFIAQLDADDFIAIDPTDESVRVTDDDDVLFGDWVVVDFGSGTAYSAGGIPFEDRGDNDGDFAFDFDNREYAAFPTALATNFIAPNADVAAELILFTLDGKPGTPPEQRFDVFYFNDDADMTDVRGIQWDCFVILDFVQEIDFGLLEVFLGGEVGHMELLPRTAQAQLHDEPPKGDSSEDRQSVFHGWIVQRIASGGAVLGLNNHGAGMNGAAAFARTLIGSGVGQTGLGSDVPSFDTEN